MSSLSLKSPNKKGKEVTESTATATETEWSENNDRGRSVSLLTRLAQHYQSQFKR